MLVIRALYGLKSSGARWHKKLAASLRDMGFKVCKADYDFWIREVIPGELYEYIAVIVDDLLIFSRNPETIIQPLREIYGYELKSVGVPEYYNGADIEYDKKANCWTMSAKTYIKNVTSKIETLLNVNLKSYGSPMLCGDHPEMDESDFLYGKDIAVYQMLIGCAQWAVTLGRFDVQYATNTLARYAAKPREGHLARVLRLFGYLKHNAKAKIYLDPTDLPYDSLVMAEDQDWSDIYPDAEEAMPDDCPDPMDLNIQTGIMLDASHGSDLETRRSVTGYLFVLGRAPIRWYSKRQSTVESATYGSELVATRIAVEGAIDLRYKLRMMGIGVKKSTILCIDNKSVVYNSSFPSSTLKKKHNSVAYHKCREAVAAGIVRTAHIDGHWNVSDILTKPKGEADYYRLLRNIMYRRQET